MRSIAVKAGERVSTQEDRDNLADKCRQYRACKQMKKSFRNEWLGACHGNSPEFWKNIDKICPQSISVNEPTGQEFVEYFQKLSWPQNRVYFDDSLKIVRNVSWKNVQKLQYNSHYDLENTIINDHFTIPGMESAMDYLKNNKAPGIDNIPAEFFKHYKSMLSQPITDVLNYIIDKRDLSECWAEGLRSVICKSEGKGVPENYRGITILPVLENVFEITVYKRIGFVNEAFCKVDPCNGGFLEGRTADNIFIIHGLAQRQRILNKNLVSCFVDFSKAFDMVDRNILLYRMIKCGWVWKGHRYPPELIY